MNSLPLHGGDLDQARLRWPHFCGEWLDLSTGINPWPYALPHIPSSIWARLPDPYLEQNFHQAARSHYGANPATMILPIPGSGSVIRALPLTRPTGNVAILGPTYGEHETAWREAGHNIQCVTSLAAASGADTIVIVTPNNPDGKTIAPGTLRDFATANPKTLMLVDQAFGETIPQLSLIPTLPSNALVITSFGKFFGLAGLRLGTIFGASDLLSPLAARMGPWPVSGPALFIGAHALNDAEWITATRQHLEDQSHQLDELLIAAQLNILGGTSLFRLIQHSNALDLWHHLGRYGILTRAFSYNTEWLRLGLPADEAAFKRLAEALGAF